MEYVVEISLVNETKGYRFSDSQETITADSLGDLYRQLQREYGRCTGRVYIDDEKPRAIGWVFTSRQAYEDSRKPYKADDYYIRDAWCSVKSHPDTVTRTKHWAPMGGRL